MVGQLLGQAASRRAWWRTAVELGLFHQARDAIWKNSSMLLAKIARNLTRSSKRIAVGPGLVEDAALELQRTQLSVDVRETSNRPAPGVGDGLERFSG